MTTPIESNTAAMSQPPADAAKTSEPAAFTPLEWSIVRLARNDKLWTIREGSPVRKILNSFLGRKANRLANERLEALRRMAVQSWHFGFSVATDKVAAFLDAGFTASQYKLLVSSVARSSDHFGIGGDVLI